MQRLKQWLHFPSLYHLSTSRLSRNPDLVTKHIIVKKKVYGVIVVRKKVVVYDRVVVGRVVVRSGLIEWRGVLKSGRNQRMWSSEGRVQPWYYLRRISRLSVHKKVTFVSFNNTFTFSSNLPASNSREFNQILNRKTSRWVREKDQDRRPGNRRGRKAKESIKTIDDKHPFHIVVDCRKSRFL